MKSVGGQAVIEGVMMRFGDNVVTAVRNPKGRIVSRGEKVSSLAKKAPFSWPVIRGIINLFETLTIGIRTLNYSADIASGGGKAVKSTKKDVALMFATGAVSLVLAVSIFKLIPLGVVQLAARYVAVFNNRWAFNAAEGMLKLGIFIGYVAAIGRMKDMRRVFQYHGAEHKAVNCYEAKRKLNVENAKSFSTLNPRCGTSFILFVIIVSILVYVFLPLDIPFFSKLMLRLLLLPVIAGVSYEVLKLGAKYKGNLFFSAVSAPGLWMQRLTTNEPDERQLEVAIFALKKAIKKS